MKARHAIAALSLICLSACGETNYYTQARNAKDRMAIAIKTGNGKDACEQSQDRANAFLGAKDEDAYRRASVDAQLICNAYADGRPPKEIEALLGQYAG